MADIIDLGVRIKDQIYKKYPPLGKNDVPNEYRKELIDYKRERIEEYDVIFWHRLLRAIYQEPFEIECELFMHKDPTGKRPQPVIMRKSEDGTKWELFGITKQNALKIESKETRPIPKSWKYFLRLPSGGIIEIGTKNRYSIPYVAHVVIGNQTGKESKKQAEKFISLLLDEANRLRDQLFNPKPEFEKAKGIKTYGIFNVYLANYISGEFMLEMAADQEEDLRSEFIKYDLETDDLHDEEKRAHVYKFMLACGMYYLSAISYFIMALEGFINIVFHAFLKKEFRGKDGKDLNIEQRLDIELKLKLMPALCHGFAEDHVASDSDIYSKFLKLRKYRNSIFHSKIADSLENVSFLEDGFVYSCDLTKHKEKFLPTHKIMLSDSDVLKVQHIVDEIIGIQMNSMSKETRMLTERYILKEPHIIINVLDDGNLAMEGIVLLKE